MAKFEKVGRAEEIPVGGMKRYMSAAGDLLLANVAGVYYAVGNNCSHAQEPLSSGMLVGKQIVCAAHYAVFDLETGDVVRHPEGATIRPIETYKVNVDDGEVLIELKD